MTVIAMSWPKRMGRLAGLALCLAMAAQTARADYRIRPGDVLGLSIIGMPDLTTRATVDADGKVNLPLAGDVAVAGSSLAEAKAKVQAILPTKDLMRRLDDGRQVPVIIAPAQLNLTIAEYRPLYIDGDVAKPGEVAFRPGITVRQAVALAGGLGLARTKADNPVTQTVELTGQYNDLAVTFAKTQVRVARLQAEVDDRPTFDPKPLASLPVAPKLRDDIVAAEQQLMAARTLDFTKERTYLKESVDRETSRTDILNQQAVKDNEGVKIDTADLNRLEDLFKKGAVALPTLSEARRTVLQSSTRALQTTASLGAVERDTGELNRRLERLGDVRRMDALNELSDATAKLASTRAQLQAVSTKLRYAGMLKPQLNQGLTEQVKIAITRNTDGKPAALEAEPDTELVPGDAVEVAVQSNDETPPSQ